MQNPNRMVEALEFALRFEKEGKEFFEKAASITSNSLGREVFQTLAEEEDVQRFHLTLATEERDHFLLILDSYDYLSDPAGWFAQKERGLLDGA